MNTQEILTAWKPLDGWCSELRAVTMAALVHAIRPAITIEVGVYGGKSLIPMALAHRQIGYGACIAIDPWKASESVAGQGEADAKWWSDQAMHDAIYKRFMEARESLGLRSRIAVYRCPSNDFEPPNGVGLVSLDGNHGMQAVTDVERFAPKVIKGGFVVMDDLTWSGGGPSKAADKLLELGFIEVVRVKEQNEWGCFKRL